MEVHTFYCDKCKKEIKEGPVNVIRVIELKLIYSTKEYELCWDCTKKIEDWILGKEEFVSECMRVFEKGYGKKIEFTNLADLDFSSYLRKSETRAIWDLMD